MACGFPTCQFSQVTQRDSGGEGGDDSIPMTVITSQPKSTKEIRLQIGGDSDLVSQVSNIASLVTSIIDHPRTQRGCITCYDQCSDPCSRHCGSFGRWFCACFKACCILETPSSSNIPEIMEKLKEAYGPISLGLAINSLKIDILSMVKEGKDLSNEEQSTLESACKEAKKQCSGGMRHLSQSFFYDSCISLVSQENIKECLHTIWGIIKIQEWNHRKHIPNPPTCWLIDTSKTILTANQEQEEGSGGSICTGLLLHGEEERRDSVCVGHTEVLSTVYASKYKQKVTQKCLSRLMVKSLLTGYVGILGFEKAHLVTWIFEKFLCIAAGPNSPLVTSRGSPSYEIRNFVQLLMLILLCCGYVPVDTSGGTEVNINDPDDPLVQIFLKSQRLYTQHQAEKMKKSLTRQLSVNGTQEAGPTVPESPADDYQLPEEIELPNDEDEDEDEVQRQKELITSSNNLSRLFFAMKQSK